MDVSREAQLASIESSFAAAHGADELGTLQHPTKTRLRAVATYEILPDADVWANVYDLFRFSERPGEPGPRCVSAASPLCRRVFCWTDEDFFYYHMGTVARRPPVGLRDHAADGIGRGSLLDLLPHEGRRRRETVLRFSRRPT